MTSDPFLIYGATGYTGQLVVAAAMRRGLRPILAGRASARLEGLAAQYGLECRTASLTDAAGLRRTLSGIKVALLTAGPFSKTAEPMVDACLASAVHYLDITGECLVIERLSTRSPEARRRNCMVMPACGFDVVASDALALHVCRRLPGACYLALGISGLVTATRGSLRTIAEQAGAPVRTRRSGTLTWVPPGALRRRFDYGNGEGWSSAVTWGDVTTAFHTTGIPNIEVYFEETVNVRAMLTAGRLFGAALQLPVAQAWLKAHTQLFPEGPTATERAVHRVVLVAEAETQSGARAVSRLHTPEPYSFSAESATEIAVRVLIGDLESGFQTPGRVYGSDLVLRFDGVRREDLD